MKKESISATEWTFFETVARAAFANPFGEARDDLDLVIGAATPGASAEAILRGVVDRIAARIEGVRGRGGADLRPLAGEKREVLRNVFLFHIFHRHLAGFDRLIQAQLQAAGAPVRVPFAHEVLAEFGTFGFTAEEGVRFFAVFYQLRRAFHFIGNCLVGTSRAMRELRKHLWDCVFTHDIRWFESRLWNRMEDFSILLLGETGTGKGAAAAALGRSGFIPYDPAGNCFGESFVRNFVAINLSQYSEGVLESELFGHRKGAFTGAVDQHEGLFGRLPPHGLIFLDEIGDIAIPVQIKLLQVLQERIFFPVGSHEATRFSGRVVAATNRPLDQLIGTGKFREDLFYRLCSDIVTLPTLRERLQEEPAELDYLLDSILKRLTGETAGREKQQVKTALKRDLGGDYHWPGNVRELEQAVKRIILTGRYRGGGQPLQTDDAGRLTAGIQTGNINAEELLAGYCALLYRRYGSYEEVSRRAVLDRRTVKKYIQQCRDVDNTI